MGTKFTEGDYVEGCGTSGRVAGFWRGAPRGLVPVRISPGTCSYRAYANCVEHSWGTGWHGLEYFLPEQLQLVRKGPPVGEQKEA